MTIRLDITPTSVVRVLLACIFLVAGITKLPDPAQFAGSIAAYRTGLPTALLKATALVLPWLEILVGLCLLARVMIRPATLLSIAMLGAFVVLSAAAALRGLEVSCGCFNLSALGIPASVTTWLEKPGVVFFRNLLLLGAAAWLGYRLIRRDDYSSAATSNT